VSALILEKVQPLWMSIIGSRTGARDEMISRNRVERTVHLCKPDGASERTMDDSPMPSDRPEKIRCNNPRLRNYQNQVLHEGDDDERSRGVR
jgi:hypothetical protein